MLAQYNALAGDFERSVCRLVLYALDELPRPLGMRKTIAFLQGKKSSFIVEGQLHQLSAYATLPFFSRDQLQTVMERMMAHRLVEIAFAGFQDMPVVALTEEGRAFLNDPDSTSPTAICFLEDFIDRSVPEFDALEADLYERLKRQRRLLAAKFEVPHFMVCSDVVLRNITKQQPLSRAALLEINGVGQIFLQKYGDDFLNAIHQHRREVG